MLTKVIALLISPLGTSLLLVALGARLLARRRGLARACFLAAIGWIVLWSMPVASDALRGAIEAKSGPRTIESVQPASVGVVLGGGVRGKRLPERPYADLHAAADRVWHAARLYHAGKVQKLLLSGGVVRSGDDSEAEAMRSLAADLGVPPEALLLEGRSTDTRGNADETLALLKGLGVREIVLVTSALHMPRARKTFEERGIRVRPAPTDFEVVPMPFDLLRVLPSAQALADSARAMKELAGLLM